jgi:DNA-binding response OmpR family regulator
MVECEIEMYNALVSIMGEKYQVSMASSKEEVLDDLSREEIDLLFVDVKVPVTKTFQLIQEAKQQKPEVAVIVTYLCFDEVQDVEHLLRKVADVCIRKPIDNYEIISKAIQQIDIKKENIKRGIRP